MKIIVNRPDNKNYKKEYLDKKYESNFRVLDINGIDKICDKIWVKNKNRLKDSQLIICRMKDNSYCLCEDFIKNNDTEIKFIFKNRRKRWMIKNGYIKRDNQIRREDKEVNSKFRQQYKVK